MTKIKSGIVPQPYSQTAPPRDTSDAKPWANLGKSEVPRPVALTIAGFDPSSGAGVTADLKTFAAHGVYGIACISALTIQSTVAVRRVEPVSGSLVRQTLECLTQDIPPSGIKIGMLGSAEVGEAVVSFLRSSVNRVQPQRMVLDPVLSSSSGRELLDPEGVRILREQLLALVGWITPNLAELAILTGSTAPDLAVPALPGMDRRSAVTAAHRLKQAAANLGNAGLNVVVTGGHLDRPDDFLLTASGEEIWFPGELVVTRATHGTGCALSSALLCRLIQGDAPGEALRQAKSYVTRALQSAYPVGQGSGPMNHLFEFDRES